MMKPYINCYYHIITLSQTSGSVQHLDCVDWTMDSHHFEATQTLLKAFSVILDILPITLYSGTGHSKKRYTFNRYI